MGIARSQTKVAVKRLRARGRITTALEDDHMSFRTVWLASAAVALTLGFSATCAAQETPGAAREEAIPACLAEKIPWLRHSWLQKSPGQGVQHETVRRWLG